MSGVTRPLELKRRRRPPVATACCRGPMPGIASGPLGDGFRETKTSGGSPDLARSPTTGETAPSRARTIEIQQEVGAQIILVGERNFRPSDRNSLPRSQLPWAAACRFGGRKIGDPAQARG